MSLKEKIKNNKLFSILTFSFFSWILLLVLLSIEGQYYYLNCVYHVCDLRNFELHLLRYIQWNAQLYNSEID